MAEARSSHGVRFYVKWTLLAIAFIAVGAALVATVGKVWHEELIRDIAQTREQKIFAPVVRLVAKYNTPYGQKQLRGSGVIVYSEPNQNGSGYDTYVLTANHVIETPLFSGKRLHSKSIGTYYDMTKVGVRRMVTYVEYFHVAGKKSIKAPAHVVAFSPNNVFHIDKEGNMKLKRKDWTGKIGGEDLALLRLETTERFHAVNLLPRERIKDLKRLDPVRLVGCALADQPGSTTGEISRMTEDFMQVSAPIVFGNSGGACFLVSTDEFIGISNAMRTTTHPMGGNIPVMHMALVRSVDRIYDWLDREKYTFIYDRTVPKAVRFETIQADKYEHHFIQKHERDLALLRADKLREKVKDLLKENEAIKKRLDRLEGKKDPETFWGPSLPIPKMSVPKIKLPECEPEPECGPETP